MTQKTQTLTPAYLIELLTNLPAGHKIELSKTPGGEVVMSQEKTKAQLIEEKYSALSGQGISLSEAARKYRVPRSTAEKWLERDYVRVVDTEAYPQLIDEAEVALLADLYHQRKAIGIFGVPFFDERGVPILRRKHPALAAYRRRRRAAQQG